MTGQYIADTNAIRARRAHGKDVAAIVWSRRENKGRGGNGIPVVTVRYRRNHRTYEADAYVTAATYNAVRQWDKVKVKYMVDDPEEVWIVGDGDPWAHHLWIIGCAGIAALALAVWGWYLRID